MKQRQLKINEIYVPLKKRKALNFAIVKDIAESILEVGQQDPILVRPDQGRFVLLDGLHRLEACKALGEEAITGVVVSERPASPNAPSSLDTALDPERQKMERLRKLRLEKEAAEKKRESSAAPHESSGRRSRTKSGSTDARPANLAEWIANRERDGFRF